MSSTAEANDAIIETKMIRTIVMMIQVMMQQVLLKPQQHSLAFLFRLFSSESDELAFFF